MKRFVCLILVFALCVFNVYAIEGIRAKSAILMAENGDILWENNADERLEPASVTKIMTLILVAEAVENGITDFAGFGRMTFAYPDFYKDYVSNGKLDKSKVCLKCSKCTELMRNASVAGCPVRDSEAYMPYYRKDVLKK